MKKYAARVYRLNKAALKTFSHRSTTSLDGSVSSIRDKSLAVDG
jgi:hypothetical protein